MDKEIKVGIADMKVARVQGLLITYALGSCIGVTLYDPVIKLGGLLHIMPPPQKMCPGIMYINSLTQGSGKCCGKCRPSGE